MFINSKELDTNSKVCQLTVTVKVKVKEYKGWDKSYKKDKGTKKDKREREREREEEDVYDINTSRRTASVITTQCPR